MKPVVLVVGVPASGKTTVCQKLAGKFLYAPHDDHEESTYAGVMANLASPSQPIIGEIPFGLSKIQGELEARGLKVIPVFIFEEEPVLRARWQARGMNKPAVIQGHLRRQTTYWQRAIELRAFKGTSAQVLEHLKALTL